MEDYMNPWAYPESLKYLRKKKYIYICDENIYVKIVPRQGGGKIFTKIIKF